MALETGERSKVLILDDDPGILLLERKALERAGYRAIPTSSAEDALQAVEQSAPDILVLDYNLNRAGTGLDFYRRLRDAGHDVPAILVTGFSDEGRAVEALRAGVRDVLRKAENYLDYLPEAVGRVLAQVRAAQRLAETEAASRAKDHFLAVLSHELRTPLTPVLTAIHILQSHPGLPSDLREPVEMIRRNVELETRLIDDLLDLTRVSRGKLELQLQPTDAHEKLRNAVQTIDSDARNKALHVELRLDATRTIVQADPARLQQIFWNLLKNAVKFTPAGGRIEVRSADTADGRLRVQVQDSGIGIDASTLNAIFNPFEQGGRDVTRKYGGLGLGLSISKTLVELHGGTISVDSPGKDQGATFTVELPATAPVTTHAPTAAGANGAAVVASDPSSSVRVLLVEDHADTARLMARLLRSNGYRVSTADSVFSALQSADTERFDVVVSDIGLPDGSGLDLMRQLLTRHKLKGIALSGFGMEEDVARSKAAGFSEHLIKPIDPRRLAAVIREVTSNAN